MPSPCYSYKCGLLALNAILLSMALALVTFGSLLQSAFHSNMVMLQGRITSPSTLIIFLGLLLFASALFGFVSTIRENYLMLSTYVCIVVTIIIFEAGVAIAVAIMKSSLKRLVFRTMYIAESHYNSSKATACMWDAVQTYLECCGMDSFQEWPPFLGTDTVPDSCCIRYSFGCGYHVNSSNIYPKGCISALHSWLFRNQVLIGVLCGIFILIQIGALLLAHLYCNVLNQRLASGGGFDFSWIIKCLKR